MLTSMYYFGYYKPYILKESTNGVSTVAKRSLMTYKCDIQQADTSAFLLNKSLKTDVVNYAKDITKNVVGTKESLKNLINSMENFNSTTYKENFSSAKDLISDNLQTFSETYNSAVGFLATQDHSVSLQRFANEIALNVENNADNLKEFGISIDTSGVISFDKNAFNSLEQDHVNVLIGENINMFQRVFSETNELLLAPLSEHMTFKNLGYYYNYKLGSMESDTFKIIQQGMLFDHAV